MNAEKVSDWHLRLYGRPLAPWQAEFVRLFAERDGRVIVVRARRGGLTALATAARFAQAEEDEAA